MLWRQLWLVGFAMLIRPGTVEQLVISYLVVLSHTCCCMRLPCPLKMTATTTLGRCVQVFTFGGPTVC